MTSPVYYLTGSGGRLHEGLGQGLLQRGCSLSGREMHGAFARLRFQEQIDLIADDLKNHWSEYSRIVAVSYGGYLLLNALADPEPCPSKILLLSPILGGVTDEETMRYNSPPRADKLMGLIDAGEYPKLEQLQIHVGEHDWQSVADRGLEFAAAVGGQCVVVPDRGHMLGEEYVGGVLDRWLL